MCDTNVFINAGAGCPTRVTFGAHPTVWSLALTHRWCPGPEWGRWFPTGRSGHAYLLTTLGTRTVSPRRDRRQRIGGTSQPSVRSPAASFRSRPRTAKTGASMEPCPPDPRGGRGCSALALNYTAGDPQPTAPPGPSIPLFWILGKGSQFGEGGEKLPKVGNVTREHFYMKANNLWKSSGNQYIGRSFSKDRMNSKQLEIIEEQTCKIPS